MTNWKRIFFMMMAIFLATLMQTAAFADSLEDAKAAYGRKDYQAAFNLWQTLANQGNAVAQTSIGVMYYNGQGVKQDYAEALKWLLKAADQGHVPAQAELGFFYFYDQAGKQDYAEAVKWYRKAAEQGDANAQSQIGWQYFTGHGVTQDSALGMQWFLRAANQGDFNAMAHLVTAYGIDNNEAERYFWASILTNSNEDWKKHRDFSAGCLTPEQKAAIDKRLQEWKPTPVSSKQ